MHCLARAADLGARRTVVAAWLGALALALAATPDARAGTVAGFDGGAPPAGASRAAAAFEAELPHAVAPGKIARRRGQVLAPVLTSSGDHLSAVGALGAPTIAKDPARGFVLDTPRGPLQAAPAFLAGESPAGATVGDVAAVFPAVAAGTDLLVRPTATGVTALLRLDGPLAATAYSWSVALATPHELRELPDGSVAVVAAGAPERRGGSGGGQAERSIDDGELADPGAQHDAARTADERASERLSERDVLALVAPPRAEDARGHAVPTRLEVEGDLIELTVVHHRGATAYPVLAQLDAGVPETLRRPWVDAPGTGRVQRGAEGLLKVLLDDGEVLLTHGPDPYVPDAVPADALPDAGERRGSGGVPGPDEDLEGPESSAGTGPPYVCSGAHKARIQVLYAGPDGAAGLDDATRTRIRKVMIASNNKLYDESVAAGGRNRPARFKFDCDSDGQIVVEPYEVAKGEFQSVVVAAKRAGFRDPHLRYVVFSERTQEGMCGEANQYPDDRLTKDNDSNVNGIYNTTVAGETPAEGTYAVVYGRRCWYPDIALHEGAHAMGAVSDHSPDASGRGHCDDGYDVMCYDDTQTAEEPVTYRNDACPTGPRGFRFDCGFDTYFDTAPEPGEWLASHWNLGHSYNQTLSFVVPKPTHESYVFFGSDGDGEVGTYAASDAKNGGTHPVPLPACEYCVAGLSPALSPDAQRVAYVGTDPSAQCNDLYLANVDGSEVHELYDCMAAPFQQPVGEPAFAAGNTRVLFRCFSGASGDDICTVTTKGEEHRRVVRWDGFQGEPAMSGSRRLLAFASSARRGGDEFGFDPFHGPRRMVFIARQDGSDALQFTPEERFAFASSPSFSHDGGRLAFTAAERGEQGAGVWMADIDGGGLRRLTPEGLNAGEPEWTPDGHVFYTVTRPDGSSYLVKLSPGTGREQAIDPKLHLAGSASFRQAAYYTLDYETPEFGPIP